MPFRVQTKQVKALKYPGIVDTIRGEGAAPKTGFFSLRLEQPPVRLSPHQRHTLDLHIEEVAHRQRQEFGRFPRNACQQGCTSIAAGT